MFYRWQKEFFENATAAFEPRTRRAGNASDRRIAPLDQKLQLVARRQSGPPGERNWRRPTPAAERPRRRELRGQSSAGYNRKTWAEDRATRGRAPSAGPGAKTGEGGTMPPHGLPGLAQKR